MRSNYVCALDLGSSKFACCLARLKIGGSVEKLFFESVPSSGIKKGRITDIQTVSDSLGQLLKKIKIKTGIHIRFVYLNIYGHDVTTRHSQTVLPLAEKRSKLITPSDVRRVTEEARLLGSNLEEEIIQIIPCSYNVDDRLNITNPLGLYGRKLGIDLFIISVQTAYLQSIERLLNRLGYEIKHLFLSGLVTSKVLLSEVSLKNGLYVFCDIGADLTEIVVFNNAVLQHIETLPLGGNDLTEEIIRTFKIPFELAEEIKHTYAYIAELDQIKEEKEVIIKKDDYHKVISQRKICEVASLKTKFICSAIKDKLDNLKIKDRPVNRIFVGGRTILIDGFLEMMESILGIPVKMVANTGLSVFDAKELDTISSVPKFLNYATTLGIINEVIDTSQRNRILTLSATGNLIQRTIDRVRDIYQEYF